MNSTDDAIGSSPVSRIEPPRISLIPFASKVSELALDSTVETTTNATSFIGERSVVGTITLLTNCAIIWVGWGCAEESLHNGDRANMDLQPVLWTGKPPQGNCTVAMPRANSYKGAFAEGLREHELPSSQIIGGGSTDSQVLAAQMASRLCSRLSIAVFVSCQLTTDIGSQSDESSSLAPLAAAAAEKEISRLVKSELGGETRMRK